MGLPATAYRKVNRDWRTRPYQFRQRANGIFNKAGERVSLPEHCVGDARKWAWTLTKRFPEIDYDWTDRYSTFRIHNN